jgi:pimeloyl-ACP methyl ester carboxylesterase
VTDYLLVHGGVEGAWCWEPMLPFLVGQPGVGQVVAVDLPGFGQRRLARHDHVTLADSVGTVVDAIGPLRDVVLVGHVAGGLTVIEASPLVADRLKRIVLLGGMVPFEGVTADDMLRLHFDGQPSQRERHAATPEHELYSMDELAPETAEWFMARVVPPEGRPARPLRTAVYPSKLPAGVPVTYVVHRQDRSVPADLQRRLVSNLPRPPDELLEIDSPRNPMVHRPADTAALLLRYA